MNRSALVSATTNRALSGLASAGLAPYRALGTINRLVDQQAYTLAASDMFYAPALISLALGPLVFLIRHTNRGWAVAMRRRDALNGRLSADCAVVMPIGLEKPHFRE